jgi:hypothetical protein
VAPELSSGPLWRKSDLGEPYPNGLRGFETVWRVEGHYSCIIGISSGGNGAVRTFLGLADYRFGFKVLLQPENPAFTTDPRLFEPTAGSKRIVTYCVDQDAASGEFSRHPVGPFRVRRAYVGDKAEFGVIRDFNNLGFRLVRQTGPKISSFAIRLSIDRMIAMELRKYNLGCRVSENEMARKTRGL